MYRQVRPRSDREPPEALNSIVDSDLPALAPTRRRTLLSRKSIGTRALRFTRPGEWHCDALSIIAREGPPHRRPEPRTTHTIAREDLSYTSHARLTGRSAQSCGCGGRRPQRAAAARTRSCHSCRIRSWNDAHPASCPCMRPRKSYTGTAAYAPDSSRAGPSPIRGRAARRTKLDVSERIRRVRAEGNRSHMRSSLLLRERAARQGT